MEAHDIARRRAELGIGVAELARAVGVDPATVWRWETGKSRPRGLSARMLEMTFRRLEQNKANRLRRRTRPTQDTTRVQEGN